ncbi:helix-turn-helix transcriptional regulator [Mesorhizobium sp. B1-1-8]|uniref:helix-turn-helix transcriptional regulator n=1 Tax=Mesorhizobium sp. B1-1-8 TaxID=2589976 RepID=UPI001D014009|nr:LuxR C-terminal-related transcriptional regulator [Mesorhizobium sp. B1-1-8]UCI07138.1 LuxR C-terminal-related transcriptional regulator [Mesorhizobium sp. B1-1-8]
MDIEALFSVLGSALDAPTVSDDEFGRTFRALMNTLVKFDHVVVFAYRGNERPIELYSSFDPDDHYVFVALYQAGPYMLDPFYHTARERRTGVFRMRQLAPDRFFSSEYYRSYYVKTGLAEEVGFFLAAADDVSIVLSLMRRQETGPFPAAEFTLLQRAAPLVSAMASRHWSGLGSRFDAAKASRRRRSRTLQAENESVWRTLKLTVREADIIELVLQGHSSESIGLRLNISTGTVKVHRRNVYRKLGISSQTELLSIYLKSLS